ncbi:MAG: TlyA family RNA methyltransferase [Clostridiales bacterium]|nr:TlyA family RNA methyltransferase [Clostridiales bacterium]
MSQKLRLDQAVLQRGLAESREKAKAYIMAGVVYVNNQKADKPGTTVGEADHIEVRANPLHYVSRGGLKLEKAMREFGLTLTGKVCADIGASTGGFTDCMLQNGAAKVYAVDVGYGQLAWKLRNDQRVVNLERTNFRYITDRQIDQPLAFASVDVSFISLTLILPALRGLMQEGGEAVCLIKPQFEAGREKVGKKGVVRDPAVHLEVVRRITDFALQQDFSVAHLTYSPIKGPEGNIEYLCHLRKDDKARYEADPPEQVVDVSHAALDAAK